MKKYNVWIPVLLTVVFITAFLLFTFFGNRGGIDHSSAEEAATSIERWKWTTAGQNLDFFSVNTTFYNYKYDNEIYKNTRNQGSQSCYDNSIIPFGTFDKALSEYYKNNNVNIGIYTGNFYNYYGGLPGVGANKKEFPGYYYFKWAANIANRHAPYDSVCQGIVYKELQDFNKDTTGSGTLMTATCGDSNIGDNTIRRVAVPYFDEIFLSKTEVDEKQLGTSIGAIQKNVNFPFRKITSGSKEGYYEFDSTKDVVRFNSMSGNPNDQTYFFGNGKLDYYYNTSFVYSKASSSPQFFPYNEANTSFSSTELGTSDKQKKLDYGFGIRFDIPFYLSADGTIDGKNMVFEFSGDDDVWIFLDGKLALDLGGQHGKATGTIDFGGSQPTAKATVTKVTHINNSTSAIDTATSDSILEADTYIESNVSTTIQDVQKGNLINDQQNKHVITVFYMERGMFESNFHMAFNFVPGEEPPEATAAPKPETPESPTETANGSLTIQNKMVFPKEINSAFSEIVKDLAEDDIFQYSIQNEGTSKKQVGKNEIKYPSGKLTVRKNGKTGSEKTSYLSFGANPKIRIYFDIGKIKELIKKGSFQIKRDYYNDTNSHAQFEFNTDSDGNILLSEDITCNGATITSNKRKLLKYTDGIYYIECIPPKENVEVSELKFKSMTWDKDWISQKIRFVFDLTQDYNGNKRVGINNLKDWDGVLIRPNDNLLVTNDAIILPYKFENGTKGYVTTSDDGNSNHPKAGGSGSIEYSSGLPYQNEGTFMYFDPNKDVNVSDTAFKLTEAHPASTNTEGTIIIKKNEKETSGKTDSNGMFDLFYDDSATFENQFITGSLMTVVQQDDLRKPVRSTVTPSEIANPEKILTTFAPRSEGEKRGVLDYYYTTKSGTEDVDVGYDGKYYFKNANNEDTTVNIKQTFTNTVKTGSLIISKKLKGNMDADSNHSYTFQVKFSNTFGDTTDTTPTLYEGSYTLEGENASKTATDGNIMLQPGQKAIISGIPVGTKYTITEVSGELTNGTDDGSVLSDIQTSYVATTTTDEDSITSPEYHEAWDGTKKVGDPNVSSIDKSTNRTISGTIPCSVVNKLYGSETNLFSKVDVMVKFTNQLGSLTITKQISGDVNNVSYYKGSPKTYTFKVTDNTNTSGEIKYVVYTYTYTDANKPPEVEKSTIKTATDGKIVLEEGQKAEIGGIPLTDNKTYTIKEEVGDKDIYFVEETKVTSGTKTENTISDGSDVEYGLVKNDTADNKVYNIATYNTKITTQPFTSTAPTFDVIFNNRYSNAYLTIEKLVDGAYGSDKNYSNDHTYQDMTNANQSFIFTVKQYKTLTEAEAGTETPESSFDIVLTMGQDNDTEYESKDDSAKDKVGSTVCKYKLSKTVKVLANRYYRIEEDTSWSWKYNLTKVDKSVHTEDTRSEVDTNKKYVVLKTYLDELRDLKQKKEANYIPIAKFYNLLDSSKTDIEGDTDSIPNKIKQK